VKRILLDQGLAPAALESLRKCGFDAVHIAEIGLDSRRGLEILLAALNDRRVCITLDHDFTPIWPQPETGGPPWLCCVSKA